MVVNGQKLKQVHGFWFPDEDVGCSSVVFREVEKLLSLPSMGSDTVVQAGGNVGVFPEALSKLFDRVLTFEPDAINYECMSLNIPSKIIKARAALSDRRGWCKTIGDSKNCGALKIVEGVGATPTLTIDSLSLDACDLIYLDVEGHEDLALLGGAETIHQHRPVLVIENNGLSPRFPSGLDGSDALRKWACDTFGYRYHSRLMRDDVFVCCK